MTPERESSARARCAQVASACDGTKGISALDCALGATYAPTIVGYPVPSHIAYGPDAQCERAADTSRWAYTGWTSRARAPPLTRDEDAIARVACVVFAFIILVILLLRARRA